MSDPSLTSAPLTPPGESHADAAARLAARYPGPRLPRWASRLIVGGVLAVLLAAFLGLAVWASAPQVSTKVVSFRVESDTRVELEWSVHRPDPTRPLRCLVYGQAVDYERVGETWVDVPAGGEPDVSLTTPIETFRRATAAAVDRCRTP